VPVHRVHLHFVEQLDPRHRNTELNRGDDGLHGALDGVERADRGGYGFRQRMETQGDLGQHAERPFGSDEEAREIVAGGRLARAGAGVDHLAVGQHHGEPEDVLAHRAVADGRRARCARGRHAAERRIRSRVDRKREPRVSQRLLQLQPRHARFDGRVEILDAHAQDPVHAAEVDRDAAAHGVNMALEGGAGAEGHDGDAMARTDSQDRGDFVGRRRKADDVGRCGDVVGLAAAVVVADAHRVSGARSEQILQLDNGFLDRRCGRSCRHPAQCNSWAPLPRRP
jgi:hypothetical protein